MSFKHMPGGCCCVGAVFDVYGGFHFTAANAGGHAEIEGEARAPQNSLYMTSTVLQQTPTALANWWWFDVQSDPLLMNDYSSLDEGWSIPMYPDEPDNHYARIVGTRTTSEVLAGADSDERVWAARRGNEDHPDAGIGADEFLNNHKYITTWNSNRDIVETDLYVEDEENPPSFNEYKIKRKSTDSGEMFVGSRYKSNELNDNEQGIYIARFVFRLAEVTSLRFEVRGIGEDGGSEKLVTVTVTESGGVPVVTASSNVREVGDPGEEEPEINLTQDVQGFHRLTFSVETGTNIQNTGHDDWAMRVVALNGTTIDDSFDLMYASMRLDGQSGGLKDLVCFNVTQQTMEEHVLPSIIFQDAYNEQVTRVGDFLPYPSTSIGVKTPVLGRDNIMHHKQTTQLQAGRVKAYVHHYPGSFSDPSGGAFGFPPDIPNLHLSYMVMTSWDYVEGVTYDILPPFPWMDPFSWKEKTGAAQGDFHYYAEIGTSGVTVSHYTDWTDPSFYESDQRAITHYDLGGGVSRDTWVASCNTKQSNRMSRILLVPPNAEGLVFAYLRPRKHFSSWQNLPDHEAGATFTNYKSVVLFEQYQIILGKPVREYREGEYCYYDPNNPPVYDPENPSELNHPDENYVPPQSDYWDGETGVWTWGDFKLKDAQWNNWILRGPEVGDTGAVLIYENSKTNTRALTPSSSGWIDRGHYQNWAFALTGQPVATTGFPNVWGHLLYGDATSTSHWGVILIDCETTTEYIATGNQFGVPRGAWEENITAETYTAKVIINGNTIWQRRIYTGDVFQSEDYGTSPKTSIRPWVGPITAITKSHTDEGLGNNNRGFVWFEQLWEDEPAESDSGVTTGTFRCHYCDASGNDIWYMDSYVDPDDAPTNHLLPFNNRNACCIMSSDKVIYIKHFLMKDDDIDGAESNGQQSYNWCCSHEPKSVNPADGPARITPIYNAEDADYTSTGGRVFKTCPMGGNHFDWLPYTLENASKFDCVKRSDKMPTPTPGEFVIEEANELSQNPEIDQMRRARPFDRSPSAFNVDFDEPITGFSISDVEWTVLSGDPVITITEVHPSGEVSEETTRGWTVRFTIEGSGEVQFYIKEDNGITSIATGKPLTNINPRTAQSPSSISE